jgi:hypothetical protein
MEHKRTVKHWAATLWTRSPLFGRIALIACAAGLFGLVSQLPVALRGPGVLVFVLAGPGSAALLWFPDLDARLSRALVPTVGIAVMILVSYLAVLEGLWHPRGQLAVMIALTAASVAVAARRSARVEVAA